MQSLKYQNIPAAIKNLVLSHKISEKSLKVINKKRTEEKENPTFPHVFNF